MDAKARRNLGAHYTSEKNILKLIGPLFMDGLRAEFDKIKGNRGRLHDFHEKIAALKFLDPACGCGNFLVIAYRELRLLEHEVIFAMYRKELDSGQMLEPRQLIKCNVDKFYGIEIEEFPAQIAQVAMWLTDHQMNLRVQEAFGNRFVRLPLVASATVVHGNALRIDWNDVVPAGELDYILGNPPFSGAMVMDDQARESFGEVFADLKGAGVLDFVAAWYWLAAKYIQGTGIEVGFVSTNSICQGEQVGLLWRPMLDRYGVHINFAHRTFKWSNEARGKAAVHCVIVGFSLNDTPSKIIFDYETIESDPHALCVSNINPYLIDAPNILLENRSDPVCAVPLMRFGNMPRDAGGLLLSSEERFEMIAGQPQAAGWIRRYLGADDFLNGGERWCLWLVDAPPEILALKPIRSRLQEVYDFRVASKALSTRNLASMPGLFAQIAQPESSYIVVPLHTSENRKFIPFGFYSPEVIASNSCSLIPEAKMTHFGVLQSSMHMAWVRVVCGRLESRYRYSKDIVYNNFPWPDLTDAKHSAVIETTAQHVLDTRAQFPDATLADLYDPLTMPPALVKAHQQLDKAVDAAYIAAEKAAGRVTPKLTTDAERVAFLFERYQALSSLLPVAKAKKARKRKEAP